MTIPIPPFTYPDPSVRRVVPFSYQDGETYLLKLERLHRFLNELVDAVNGVLGDREDEFVVVVNEIIASVNAKMSEYDEKFRDWSGQVEQTLDSWDAATLQRHEVWRAEVDQIIADVGVALDAVNERAEQWLDSQIENNDTITAAIFSDPGSETRGSLSDIIAAVIGGQLAAAGSAEVAAGPEWAVSVTVADGRARFRFVVPPVATPPAAPLGGTVNLNDYTATGRYSATVSTELASSNLPSSVRQVIEVVNSGGSVVQFSTALQEDTRWWRVQFGGVWRPWQRMSNNVQALTVARDYDTIITPGQYMMVAGAALGASANMPEVARHVLTVAGDGINYVSQSWHNLVTGRMWKRTRNVNVWSAWAQEATSADIAVVTSTSDAGLASAVLIEDWSRRRGGRRKVQTGAVALRFDHGLANFNTKIRPLLEARSLPYALALCSGAWGQAENTGVTASMVDAWVAGGLAEVWNHSRTHAGSETESGWRDQIGTGLTELRSQLPSAQIDGFAVPGTAGVGYGDFEAGSTASEFFATPAGRFILSTHAVATGYIAGTAQRVLDGVPRQGQGHSTLDSASAASVIGLVDAAKAGRTGLQLMLHPSLVDTASYITRATLTQILDYIAAERDAGRLTVLGPYDLMLADAT